MRSWFFSYLTELGPSELKEYINRFRKSDQGIESRARGHYRGHLGDGRSPPTVRCTWACAGADGDLAAPSRRRR